MIHIVYKHFKSTPERLVSKIISELGAGSCRMVQLGDNKRLKINTDDVVISWGYPTEFEMTNTPSAIIGNYAKLNKVDVLTELCSSGIKTPHFQYEEPYFMDNKKWLARKANGFGGEDVIMVDSYEHWEELRSNGYAFLSEYIDKVAEFRVHVFNNKVLCVTRKKPENEDMDIHDYLAWNHNFGFVQTEFKNVFYNEILGKISIDALEAIGYNFGAVDIIVNKYGVPYVLEVNSAPSLSTDSRIDYYVDEIVNLHNDTYEDISELEECFDEDDED